jgi:nicotinamidase-related amidase
MLQPRTSEKEGDVKVQRTDTALVIIDPQNDVLSDKGTSWPLLAQGLKELNTIENIERLFRTAKDRSFGVFISPHYIYPADRNWLFAGFGEKLMLDAKEFFRASPTSAEGLAGSGADWLERYKPYIDDGKTIIASPHKVSSPTSNDLVFQLRKQRIDKVILGGMLANFCVESHLRELIEQGFEVAVVKDATAAPRHPKIGDGYPGAVINYGYFASAVWTTNQAVEAMT